MPKDQINWRQLHRYYTFERDSVYCVGYFYAGSGMQWTRKFDSQEARADFVRENLQGFRGFKP